MAHATVLQKNAPCTVLGDQPQTATPCSRVGGDNPTSHSGNTPVSSAVRNSCARADEGHLLRVPSSLVGTTKPLCWTPRSLSRAHPRGDSTDIENKNFTRSCAQRSLAQSPTRHATGHNILRSSSAPVAAAGEEKRRDGSSSWKGTADESILGQICNPQPRPEWLRMVTAQIRALQHKTEALDLATEKMLQSREWTRHTLLEEISQLEGEAARCSAVLSERDVLLRLVDQLESQLAAAKVAEATRLSAHGAVAVVGPIPTKEPPLSQSATPLTGKYLPQSRQQWRTTPLAEPYLGSFIDAAPARQRNTLEKSTPPPPDPPPDPPSPPLQQVCRSTRPVRRDEELITSGGHPWSGRRIPLTTTTAPLARLPRAPHQHPSQSRSRPTAELSLLSTSQSEVGDAALASDGDSDSSAAETPVSQVGGRRCTSAGGSRIGMVKGSASALQPPSMGTRRTAQRLTSSAAQASSGPTGRLGTVLYV